MALGYLIGVVLVALLVVAYASCSSPPPPLMSELDQSVLMQTDAQLQLLQIRYQKEAEPIIRKQTETLERVCKAAHLTWQIDCLADANTRKVTKKEKPATPASVPAPTAKK